MHKHLLEAHFLRVDIVCWWPKNPSLFLKVSIWISVFANKSSSINFFMQTNNSLLISECVEKFESYW